MSNAFFNWTFDVTPGSSVRSRPVEAEFEAIGVGFDRAEVKTKAALKAPDGETLNDLPAAAVRLGKSIFFNATTGQPELTVAATSAEMTAAVTAASNASASAAAASASAASVAGSTNALQMLQLAAGVR